jgi:hypothetical protein
LPGRSRLGGVHLLVRARPEIFQEVLWTNLLSLVQSRGIDMISPGINCHKMEGDTPEAVNPKVCIDDFFVPAQSFQTNQ